MKKFILSIFAALSVFALGSCNNSKESYTLDDSAKETELAKSWFNSIEWNSDAINKADNNDKTENDKTVKGYDSSKTAHYEVFLPSDISANLKLNVSNIASYDKKSTVYANYASCTNLSSSDYGKIIDVISQDTTVKTATTYEPFKKYSTAIDPIEGFIDAAKDSKMFAVVYIPSKVEYIKYDSEGTRKTSLRTFVLVPVYAATTTVSNGVYSDAKVEALKGKSFTFTVKKGAIQ